MRIVLLARGTRGDVQPMVVLAAELRRRGHEVILGAPPNLVYFAAQAGFDARPVRPDFHAFLGSAEGQALLASGNANELNGAGISARRANRNSQLGGYGADR